MKLINKQTGEIATLTLSSNGEELLIMKNNEMVTRNVKLSDLENWREYEELKHWWFIDCNGKVFRGENANTEHTEEHKSIGNYYTSSEKAKKAVEKLQAWKRLKDNGFKFEGIEKRGRHINFYQGRSYETDKQCQQAMKDLDLLFGGEE